MERFDILEPRSGLSRLAVALLALAMSPALAAQDAAPEARAIFRSWQLLDAPAEAGPWDKYKKNPIIGAVWQDLTVSGDQLWIDEKDLSRGGGTITFWLRGDYSGNSKVKHRTGLWRMRINCNDKTVAVLATSTYAADGVPIEERDYPRAQSTAIRPGTIYNSIAEKLCP